MTKYAKVLLASIALFGACTDKKEIPTPTASVTTAPAIKTEPAIVEAREWFEQNVAPQAARQPIWDKATVTMRNGKPEVYVPIRFISGRTAAKGERRRLLIAFDEQGVRQALLYNLVSEASYAKASNNQVRTDNFTGLALNFNWENDNFISGRKYVGGKSVGDVSKSVAKNSVQKPSNDCTIVTVTYYSQACSGGSCTDPVVVGVQTYTYCSGGIGGGGPSGGDGGGIGGGPSGGGGGGPSGGGGGGTGCGDALVCPDGSENPNTTTTILTAGPPPPDVTQYNCNQLRNTHSDDDIQNGVPNTISGFASANVGLTREQIIGQRGYDNSIPGVTLPMGPNARYIQDPLNPIVVIDLRHMLVVAYYGPFFGNSVEVTQGIGGLQSAYDHQDYFSNQLGYDFYDKYGSQISANPSAFASFVQLFLTDRSARSRNTSPDLIKQHCSF